MHKLIILLIYFDFNFSKKSFKNLPATSLPPKPKAKPKAKPKEAKIMLTANKTVLLAIPNCSKNADIENIIITISEILPKILA